MQIRIIAVGKLKEKYWREGTGEYTKRLGPYARIEIIEVAEERVRENPSPGEIQQVINREGERIMNHLSPSFFVIPLAMEGKMFSSEALSGLLGKLSLEGKSQVAFVIGGSHGLSEEVLERGDLLLSFSRMTFPHQMMRLILLEQIYRGFKILKGEPYHK